MEAAHALGRAPIDVPEVEPAVRRRPSRAEIEAILPSLLDRRAEILAHARRFSYSPEDAEDAYQRGLEILLTKAPSTDENDLVPWLKTVVKHEAFAISRARGRAGVPSEETLQMVQSTAPAPDEQAEHYERLRTGAEAMSRLKPQEIQAMLLRAEGHSYAEIQASTGWSYTKVDRCLKEGRKSFVGHVHGIETGAECAHLEPLLSAFADGEARATEMLRLRRHLRSCAGCRATVGHYRGAPRELAAIAPPLVAVAGAHELASGDASGALQRTYEAAAFWLQDKTVLIGTRLHDAVEAAGGAKVAAVAMSSVALAGGGVAAVDHAERQDHRTRPAKVAAAPESAPDAPPSEPATGMAGEEADAPAAGETPKGQSQEGEKQRPEAPKAPPEPVKEEFAPSAKAAAPRHEPHAEGGGPSRRADDSGAGGSKDGKAGEFGL